MPELTIVGRIIKCNLQKMGGKKEGLFSLCFSSIAFNRVKKNKGDTIP